jgi:4'-phosphopantetheinyl transferase
MSEELRSGADLWLLDEAAVAQAVADYQATGILSAAERARHERLRDPGGRSRYLGGRMLVRFVLAAYTGVAPANLEFDTGPYGRPELVPNPRGFSFNLAHTSGLIAFLLTRGRLCGVDIERRPAPADVVEAVAQFLSAEERAHLRTLGQDREATALEYWVVKEAYLKALGVGLSRTLDSFTVRGLGSVDVQIEDPYSPVRSWQIELQQLTADHLVGLAIAGDQRSPARIPVRILDFSAFLRAAIPPTGRAAEAETGGNSTPRATIRSWPNREESG